ILQMPSWPHTIVLVFDGHVDCADVPSLCGCVTAILEGSGAEVALCDVGGLTADAVAVDALARIRLAARRLGREVRLRDASDEPRQPMPGPTHQVRMSRRPLSHRSYGGIDCVASSWIRDVSACMS